MQNLKEIFRKISRCLHTWEEQSTKRISVFFKTVVCICVLVMVVITLGPFVWMYLGGFKTPYEITKFPPTFFPNSFSLKNFTEVWDALTLSTILLNSALFTGVTTATTLFFCSVAGYVFGSFEFPGRDVLFLVILSTMIFPLEVLIIPLYLIMFKLKWVNTYQGLMAPLLMSTFGVFLMRQTILGIPRDLFDAAVIDGCSIFGIYYRVVLPNIKSTLIALGILTAVWSWDSFVWPIIILNSENRFTLPIGLAMLSGQYFTRYHLLMAGATLGSIPMLVTYAIAQKFIIKGVALSGLKM